MPAMAWRSLRGTTLVLCESLHSWGGIAADKTLTARAHCVVVAYPQFTMFWILRRTRLTSAAAFFNAINNNNQSSNNATGKSVLLRYSICSRRIKSILECCYLGFNFFFPARLQSGCQKRLLLRVVCPSACPHETTPIPVDRFS